VLRIVLIRLVAVDLNHAIAQSSQRYQSAAADKLDTVGVHGRCYAAVLTKLFICFAYS
jgi:hypothetical protein